jgi:hypothetical protein
LSTHFETDPELIANLLERPDHKFPASMGGQRYSASVGIADYRDRITAFYKTELAGRSLDELARQLETTVPFQHLGLVLYFENQTNLVLNDEAQHLNADLRRLVDTFGPVVLRNACLDSKFEIQEQRNIFPHMRFHYDRSSLQESQVSLFSRNPEDAEQRFPRQSSTLFVPNLVAWLQNRHEGQGQGETEPEMRASYDLFREENVRPLFGDIVFDQPWNEPEGTGELCVINNRTLLHASFHGDLRGKGWRIGARYLV